MKRNGFLLSGLIMICSPLLHAQQQYLFEYRKEELAKGSVYHLMGEKTISFSPFVSTADRKRVQSFYSPQGDIKAVWGKGKTGTLQDAAGNVLATLERKGKWPNVILPAGKRYTFKKLSADEWAYMDGERKAVYVRYNKNKGKRTLEMTTDEVDGLASGLLMNMAGSYTAYLIHQRTTTPILILVGVGLAAVRIATTDSGTPESAYP